MNDRLQAPFQRLIEEAPTLRILIPYAIGVAAGEHIATSEDAIATFGGHIATSFEVTSAFFVAAALLLIIYVSLNAMRWANRHAFGRVVMAVALFGCAMSMGCGADMLSRRGEVAEWPEKETTWCGVVMEQPRATRKTCALTLRLDSNGGGRKVLVSLWKDNIDTPPKVGDAICFRCAMERPHRIKSKGNSAGNSSFDYSRYLYRHGYTGTALLFRSPTLLPTAMADSLISQMAWSKRITVRANTLRHKLANRYQMSGLQDDETAVLSALTLGERSGVSRDTRNVFSQTGASHILALSGLHLGILVSIIMMVLRPLRLTRRCQWLALGLCMALVWAFVVLTGGSVSIVRSAMMLSLTLLFSMRGQGYASLGNMALAALLILILSPRSLMDVGFQLSFLAVFFILYFLPYYQEWADGLGHGLWRRLADFVFVSVAAQVGTAPVVASVFGRLPLYFLLTNTIVIPCAYLLLGGAVLFFIIGWWQVLGAVLAKFLGIITLFMTTSLEWIASLPLASVSIHLSSLACWTLYPFMLTLFAFFYFRRACYLPWVAAFGGLFLTAAIWT